MASLTAALNAVASLQASLGVSPLQLGFLAIQLRVSLKLSALLATLSARFGLNLSGGGGSLLRGTARAAAEPAIRADEFCHQRVGAGGIADERVRLAELAGAAVAAGDRDRPADLRVCRLAECRAGASGGVVRAVRPGLRCGASHALAGDGHGGGVAGARSACPMLMLIGAVMRL